MNGYWKWLRQKYIPNIPDLVGTLILLGYVATLVGPFIVPFFVLVTHGFDGWAFVFSLLSIAIYGFLSGSYVIYLDEKEKASSESSENTEES